LERRRVAPRLDKEDLVRLVLRLEHIELLAAVLFPRQPRVLLHQRDKGVAMRGLQLELDDDHDAAHRRFLPRRFRGSVGDRSRPRQARTQAFGPWVLGHREEITMSHAALRTILPVAGLDPDRARSVEITGGAAPILPTSFKIGETSAACLSAI